MKFTINLVGHPRISVEADAISHPSDDCVALSRDNKIVALFPTKQIQSIVAKDAIVKPSGDSTVKSVDNAVKAD